MAPAISVRNISKRFRLYHERQSTLKERFIRAGRRSYDDLWALDDVSFDVEPGSTFGLMGHNGSGKSTLLKLIGGILQPTSGEIITHGRIAALLELGAGMQPDLTGRENIFLNGSILGLSRKELEKRFDDIVAFSELDQFIDTQVRLYSSGMYVRLGFAVAVNVDPDILLVDEVLAVGDELFQRKCIERVKQFQREGRTIIFVTHSVDQIRKIGDSAAVLEKGKLIYAGEPGDAIREFREKLFIGDVHTEGAPPAGSPVKIKSVNESNEVKDELNTKKGKSKKTSAEKSAKTPGIQEFDSTHYRKIKITGAAFQNPENDTSNHIHTGGALQAQISWDANEEVAEPLFTLEVFDNYGNLIFEQTTKEYDVGKLKGTGNAWFYWKEIPLSDGTYKANVGITSRDGGIVYDWIEGQYSFEVTNDFTSFGLLHLNPDISVNTIEEN